MRRTLLFSLLAGFLVACGLGLAQANGGIGRVPEVSEHQVPLQWIAEALAGMPFIIPPAR